MQRFLLLLLLVTSGQLLAGDTFRVEIRMIERAANAGAPKEFPDADSIPLSASMSVKSKESGRFDSAEPLKLPDVTSDAPTRIPIGVVLQVTPVLNGDKLTYRVQVTHSVPVFQTLKPIPQSAAEVSSTSAYQSGPCEPGVPVWFSYTVPESGKTMHVGLRFDKEK